MTLAPSGLTIGELARHSGVGVETIRFYERFGLVEQPERPSSGYRRYPPEAASRLRFIQRAKELGFTLRETEELLALREAPGATRAEVKERAMHKLADLDSRIRDLVEIRTQLADLVKTCDGVGPAEQCSILASLDHGSTPERTELGTEYHGR